MKMSMKELISQSIDKASTLGADACDIIVDSGEKMKLSALNGALEKYELSKTQTLGIRVIKNKKIGLAYTESLDTDAIEFAIKNAIANSEFSSLSEHETINTKNLEIKEQAVQTKDTSSTEEKIDFTLRLESEVKKKDKRFSSAPYNGLVTTESQSYYMNSLGTYVARQENYLSAYTSSLLKENDLTSVHYAGLIGRQLKDLDLNACVDECLEHAASWLHAQPVPTGKYDVIFNIDTLSEIFDSFGSYFSAKSAMDGLNPWKEKLNQQVAIENFSILDTPLYARAFFQKNVDSEGNISQDLKLIENGVFKNMYHNTATANFFNTQTNARASRSSRSPLNVSGTNWLINPGTSSLSDLTDGTYLEVISTMGLGPGTDPISGDFSFGASGYLCKNGKRLQAVKGITIAGNFNDLLMNIKMMGDQVLNNYEQSTFSPLIRFSDLSTAGK